MNKKNIISAILGIITGFLNGLFGSGGGTILVPGLEKFLKFEEHKAHATAIAIILPLSILSTFIYLKDANLEYLKVIVISIGGMIGGYLGAKFLKKIPGKWLHKIFGLFMLIASWRMILWYCYFLLVYFLE